MRMWNLDESAITSLRELPETGMGFQLVEAVIWGNATPLLVLNSEHAIDLSRIELEPGDDPNVILRNGLRIIDAMKLDLMNYLFGEPRRVSGHLSTLVHPTRVEDNATVMVEHHGGVRSVVDVRWHSRVPRDEFRI